MKSTSRTVNPALSHALTGRGSVLIDERAHSLLLHDLLHEHGAAGVLSAGSTFAATSRHELVKALAECRSPHELSQRFRTVERLFHLGHRTEHDCAPGALYVRHVAHLGGQPSVAESLFVCGAFIGMCERVGVADLTACLSDGRGHSFDVSPNLVSPAMSGLRAPISWALHWTEPSPTSATPAASIDERLRTLVAQQPCRQWRLADAAAAFGLSRRSLQRALAAHATSAQTLFVAGRVDAAAALLARTALPIAHIAAITGFTDAAHLTRCYGRVNGTTPARARAAAMRLASAGQPAN